MSVLHPEHGPNPVHTVHRIGAASIGAFLVLFAVWGSVVVWTTCRRRAHR